MLWALNTYKDNPFYFVHGGDFRGRVYPSGSFMTYQGSDRSKGCLEFANGAVLKNGDMKWVANNTANLWGLDKASVQEKVEWFDDSYSQLISYASDPSANQGWLDAEDPFQFLNACVNLQTDACHTPIAFDGTNNGLQILSAVLRDPVGAFSTNPDTLRDPPGYLLGCRKGSR